MHRSSLALPTPPTPFDALTKGRVPLADSAVIEAVLGKYSIISVEDLVHRIQAGKQFPLALQPLEPHRRLARAQVQALRRGW